MKFHVPLVLACIAGSGLGRRVQSSLAHLQSDPKVVNKTDEMSDAGSSFVEMNAAYGPSGLAARNPSMASPRIPHAVRIPRIPPTSMSVIQPSEEKKEEKAAAAVPFAADNALKTSKQEPLVDSKPTKHESEATPLSEKEPWYGNMRLNALVLLIAKVLTRVALTFRSRVFSGAAADAKLATAGASARTSPVSMSTDGEAKGGLDVPLLICFALWYVGNYYYNITNKLALNAAGGASGFPMTIATLQLGVGVVYALFLWAAPDARKRPAITFDDYMKTLPVGFTAAGAHAASVFALSAGAVSFAQIVKAAEPAFAAVLGSLFYGASVSTAKWFCLIPIIGGVVMASLGELSFAWAALATAAIANVFAAIKANENKKLMNTEGLSDRLGSIGNQFALTTINSFLFCLPLMLLTEGRKLGAFWELCKTTPVILNNMVFSGLWFYLYNELATLTIKKTGAVTQSVANTAKRVIVIIVVAIVMGESLGFLKLLGCGIGIGGVFLYSIIDKLVGTKKSEEGSRSGDAKMADTSAPRRWQLPSRRDIMTKVFGASAFGGAAAANAVVDYAGVGYLGGAQTIDVNNANVRVYQKLPGMYPDAAGKIVAKAPYKDKADMYAKAGFDSAEAEVTKKYDKDFIFLEPQAEFVIDNINNGLYR
jgi:solute carrier family 35 protein E1